MSLSILGVGLTVLACRDITAFDRPDKLAARHLLDVPSAVIVSPDNMHGWRFSTNEPFTLCFDGECRMVQGPGNSPAGGGSAELRTSSLDDARALSLVDFQGIRFDAITGLHYSTYRQSVDTANNLAISLQFDVDYDLTDDYVDNQERVVFEPSQGHAGEILQNTWQSWDAKAGKWWGTHSVGRVNGLPVTNPCVRATPCTWAQLLVAFPNIGVLANEGFVTFVAGPNSPGFIGNMDNFTISVNGVVRTFDFEARHPFPATFPNSLSQEQWDSLSAPANVISIESSVAPKVIRDVLYVAFTDAATIAERAAAIAAIDGHVLGGELGYMYVVRIPYMLTNGDSASGPVLRAAATLAQNSVVDFATPAYLGGPTPKYIRPKFGPGFTSWPLSPDSASLGGGNKNWSLVGIDAPQAWGCSTGETLWGEARPPIAILDDGFYPIADLSANIASSDTSELSNNLRPDDDPNDFHGTRVASIVAAVGHSGGGATGVMWKANLKLVNVHRKGGHDQLQDQMASIDRAMKTGARVINMSLGLTPHAQPTTQDSIDAQTTARRFRRQVKETLTNNPALSMPLFVISAGNESVDAKYSGYATAAQDPEFRKHMLVVGATQLQSTGVQSLAAFSDGTKSNSGTLVDVVAPGKLVATLDLASNPILGEGTSRAAPLVTGVAGLLVTFDPSLSADSLRILILAGATRAGRTVADPLVPARRLPILNAYEPLKLAAARKGAPLCGNIIFGNRTNYLAVERRPANAAAFVDTILRASQEPGLSTFSYTHKFHGGHLIDLRSQNVSGDGMELDARFVGGHWVFGHPANDPEEGERPAIGFGGDDAFAYLTHDADSVVTWGYECATPGVCHVGEILPHYRVDIRPVGGPVSRSSGLIVGRLAALAAPVNGVDAYVINTPAGYLPTQTRPATFIVVNFQTGVARTVASIAAFRSGTIEPTEDGKEVLVSYQIGNPANQTVGCGYDIYSTADWLLPPRHIVFPSSSCGQMTAAPNRAPNPSPTVVRMSRR